jgi:hypothetical protein
VAGKRRHRTAEPRGCRAVRLERRRQPAGQEQPCRPGRAERLGRARPRLEHAVLDERAAVVESRRRVHAEGLEHEPQERRGRVPPGAVVVRAAEDDRELRVRLGPPRGRHQQLLPGRQPERRRQLREPIAGRRLGGQERPHLRERRAPGLGADADRHDDSLDLGARGLAVEPPCRAQALEVGREAEAQHLQVDPQSPVGAHGATSTTAVGPATLPARSTISVGPAGVAAGDRDLHGHGRHEGHVRRRESFPGQEDLDVVGGVHGVEVDGHALRERAAGAGDPGDDGEADAVPPDRKPRLGGRHLEPPRSRREIARRQRETDGAGRSRRRRHEGHRPSLRGAGRVAALAREREHRAPGQALGGHEHVVAEARPRWVDRAQARSHRRHHRDPARAHGRPRDVHLAASTTTRLTS